MSTCAIGGFCLGANGGVTGARLLTELFNHKEEKKSFSTRCIPRA